MDDGSRKLNVANSFLDEHLYDSLLIIHIHFIDLSCKLGC